MDINQLRQAVNSLSPEQLQDFSAEAVVRYGVNQLCNKPVREHLLAAAEHLIAERMALLGVKPRAKRIMRPQNMPHIIDRRQKPSGRHGRVRIIKEAVK